VTSAIRSVFLDTVISTNTVALEMASAGEPGPLWVVAGRQTGGRGRNGRHWASVPGNLYASLLLRPACPLAIVHQLSLLAGVAVCEAMREAARGVPLPGLRLKWPNDVLIGGAKCAGILPESRSRAGGERIVAVIGIGINLASHPTGLGRAATDLAVHGVRLTPAAMLACLSDAMARWLAVWNCGAGFARVRTGWLAAAGDAGESLIVDTGVAQISGRFVDLDAGGALVLRDAAGVLRTLTFGDVSLTPATASFRDDA
jgi:BirA family biotin operon repressor/biotin-[acetyl-CoA-carboxylase] ligase